MQITRNLFNLLERTIAESFSRPAMIDLVSTLIENYDLYKRIGYPANLPIPNREAAKQIVKDIIESNLFLEFVNLLVRIHYDGYRGRQLNVSHLREIMKEIYENGYIYDKENKLFIEDFSVRRTRNWGALRHGEEYNFTFLRLDIVKNTELVRKHSEEIVRATYDDFRKLVEKIIIKRNGRFWSWEGDGALIAFFFSEKNLHATLCGMEIIHELFIYNQIYCRLDNPLLVRFAIHNGPCVYTENDEELKKNEAVKKIMEMESRYTKPNTLTITNRIHITLGTTLSPLFLPVGESEHVNYFTYQLRWS